MFLTAYVSILQLSFLFPHPLQCDDSGHALEAGWFLLQYGVEHGDKELQQTAIDKFMELPYQTGWDKEHSGLFYFLDVDGYCPTQVQYNKGLFVPVDLCVSFRE